MKKRISEIKEDLLKTASHEMVKHYARLQDYPSSIATILNKCNLSDAIEKLTEYYTSGANRIGVDVNEVIMLKENCRCLESF